MSDDRYEPPYLDKISFIARYYLSGCTAPWSLYAEKARPEAKDIALILMGLSMQDIVKEFFRPKGLNPKRHSRRGRSRPRRGGGVPDPNDLVAKNIPGQELVADRKYGLGTRALYVFDDAVDRVTWTLALLQMATDLTYTSLLGVAEQQGHACPNLGRMHMKGGYHVEGGVGPDWMSVGLGSVEYAIKCAYGGSSVTFMQEGTWSYTFAAQLRAPNGATRVRMRVINTGPSGKVYDLTEFVNVPTSGHVDIIVNATLEGPITVALQANDEGGFWDVVHSDLTLLEIL